MSATPDAGPRQCAKRSPITCGDGGSMSHVFLSYAHEDRGFTGDLARDLERRGLRCWIDQEAIRAAQPWREEIAQAIQQCGAFLIVLSPRSVASDEVNRELAYAASSGRRIVPLVYKSVQLPPAIGLTLGNLQWVNFDERTYEDAFAALMRALVPEEKKPPALGRPALVWLISGAYLLGGVNFLASFGTCLAHVAMSLGRSRVCVDGLGLPLAPLILLDLFLVLSVVAGVVLFQQRRSAVPLFAVQWGLNALLAAWSFFLHRYQGGLLAGLVVATLALWYVVRINRQGESAVGRLVAAEPVMPGSAPQLHHRSETEVHHERSRNHDQRQEEDGEVSR